MDHTMYKIVIISPDSNNNIEDDDRSLILICEAQVSVGRRREGNQFSNDSVHHTGRLYMYLLSYT
jgi:hypothetical protein